MTAPTTQRPNGDRSPAGPGGEVESTNGPASTIRSLWYLCPLVVIWAATIGAAVVAVPVFASWLASSAWEQGIAGPLRLTVLGWVVVHDVPVRVDGVTYSLLPWGMAVVPFVLLWLGGRWAGRISGIVSLRSSLTLVLGTAVLYAGAIGIAAWVVSAPDLRLSAPRAVITAGVLATGAVALGVYRRSAAGARMRQEFPESARVMLGAAAVGIVALLTFGCALVAASLIRNFSTAVDLSTRLDAGPVGGLALLVMGLGYLPVISTWAVAYAVGAGVSLGPMVLAAPFNAIPSAAVLPQLPLVAAIPTRSLEWPMAPMAIGVLAGLLVGWYVGRSAPRTTLHRIGLAAGSALLVGLGMAMCSALARGSLGEERLAILGPNPPSVAAAVIGLVVVGAIPAALLARPRRKLSLMPVPSVLGSIGREGSTT